MVLLYIHSNDHQYIIRTLSSKIGDFLKRNETTKEIQNLLTVLELNDIQTLTDFVKKNAVLTIGLDPIDICYFISLPNVEDISYAAVVTSVRRNGYYWFG